MKKKLYLIYLIATLISAMFITSAYGVLTTSKSVASNGKIWTINVGVYKDSACTQPAASIDWGNLTAGASTTYTLYIKNTGSSRETLSLTTNTWTPSTAAQGLTITWDKNNTALNANAVVMATLTLAVSANIDASIASFTNNIIITGTM